MGPKPYFERCDDHYHKDGKQCVLVKYHEGPPLYEAAPIGIGVMDHIDIETLLSAVLAGWQKNQGLPSESADEQVINRKDLSSAQRNWLYKFILLWDETQEGEQGDR